jgi:hypothetical protein
VHGPGDGTTVFMAAAMMVTALLLALGQGRTRPAAALSGS